MKKLLLILALTAFAALPFAAMADDAASQTLEGEYVWERDDKDISGPIKAVFEPTGEATWNVSFYFSFEDKPHIYSGTAQGSLTDGELAGSVMTDGDEPRPFDFAGQFVEGKFDGTHSSERDGETHQTGTISFSH